MGTITVTVTKQDGSPYPNAHVHIDWSQLGIPAGSDDGYTNAQGIVTFSETIGIIGVDGAGKASSGLDYATFSIHADAFGNGSASVVLTFNPSGSAGSLFSSLYWLVIGTIILLALIFGVFYLAKGKTPQVLIQQIRSKLKK